MQKRRQVTESTPSTVWTAAQANEWYDKLPWMVGANFIPSTAINQLEMWQKESFDTATIAKELGWASGIGFNTDAGIPASPGLDPGQAGIQRAGR